MEEVDRISMNKLKMAKLVPLSSLLLFLMIVITSCAEVLSVEVDGGPNAAVQVCDINFKICLGSCWKSGNCMRCCKHHGFVHGRCSLKHGDGCYCCHTPDQK